MSQLRIVDIPHTDLDKSNSKGVIGLAASLKPEQIIQLVHETGVCHVVQKSGLEFDKEMAAAKRLIQSPQDFFDSPLDVILGESSSESAARADFSVQSTADEKKGKTLRLFEGFLKGVRGTSAIVDQALMAADELYTNASKNAWSESHKLFVGKPERGGSLEFFARADGRRLAFGCRDSFGEIDIFALVARIHGCFQKGVAGSIHHGAGGAGIGSYMVFNSALGYYVGVEKGKQSIVCVTLPLGVGNREQTELPKNIHLVSL